MTNSSEVTLKSLSPIDNSSRTPNPTNNLPSFAYKSFHLDPLSLHSPSNSNSNSNSSSNWPFCFSLPSIRPALLLILPAQLMPEKTLQGLHVLARDNPPSKRLEGKIAIVTGGARGIGESTARLFARHGAKVVIADVEDTAGTAVADSLAPSASFVHCDVSLEEDIENLVASTISRYGRIDIFFNNAGVLGDQKKHKSIVDFDIDEFDRVMRVNVRGVALGIKHAARVMIPRGGGCIISTASVAGVMGGLGPHAYTASKHAIVGLTKNTACELGRYGIRVNCISPFGVATWMLVNAWRNSGSDECLLIQKEECMNIGIPCEQEVEKMEEFVRGLGNLKGQTLRAKDIAEAALYLASDESKYVSGHNLVVDGGVTTSRNCVGL